MHEYSFNSIEFENHAKNTKIVTEKINNKKVKKENEIDLQGINDLIAYQNNCMTQNIQNIMKQSVYKVTIIEPLN